MHKYTYLPNLQLSIITYNDITIRKYVNIEGGTYNAMDYMDTVEYFAVINHARSRNIHVQTFNQNILMCQYLPSI
jgi:hypothetical protein